MFVGLSALGGVILGASVIYGAAATIGIPLPKPAFDVDINSVKRKVSQEIKAHRLKHDEIWKKFEEKYNTQIAGMDRRLSRVERRQIESILVSLQGQLRQTEREIQEARRAGRPPSGSAIRERERLKRSIRSYERELFGRSR